MKQLNPLFYFSTKESGYWINGTGYRDTSQKYYDRWSRERLIHIIRRIQTDPNNMYLTVLEELKRK